MNTKLCSYKSLECWSLHALWDAEMIKLEESDLNMYGKKLKRFDVLAQAQKMSEILCLAYDYPRFFYLENYVIKYRSVMKSLISDAAIRTAEILNGRIQFAGINH